jgi:hypothetical protein
MPPITVVVVVVGPVVVIVPVVVVVIVPVAFAAMVPVLRTGVAVAPRGVAGPVARAGIGTGMEPPL